MLVMGGTTEGRHAARVCDQAAHPFLYSTRSGDQQIASAYAQCLEGALDATALSVLCRQRGIEMIVDAAHPYAAVLHANIGEAAQAAGCMVIRYERLRESTSCPIHWVDNLDELAVRLKELQVRVALSLAGVKSIAPLQEFWRNRTLYVRIMDRHDSWLAVDEAGFSRRHVVLYREGQNEAELYAELRPEAIIVKDDGREGGYVRKVEAAHRLGIPVFALRCPALPYQPTATVHGAFGLRRAIEELLPGYFSLRVGLTTGSCATAATAAALQTLLTGDAPREVPIELPSGEPVRIEVAHVESIGPHTAQASVKKFAGDDPDITNGQLICARVDLVSAHSQVCFLQGEGVGRVTLPGLGLPIGEPAINATPRAMMQRAVERLLAEYCAGEWGVDITISVPGGRELAAKTFNPKLGIVGGVSIIGTSGVVKPYSLEAFLASVKREIQVAFAVYPQRLVLNSGSRSLQFLTALYPSLPSSAFVQFGNFVGGAIEEAARLGFREVTLGIMLGKAVKLAEGALDTHSQRGAMNRAFLARVAEEAGCCPAAVGAMAQVNTARQLWTLLAADDLTRFITSIVRRCYAVCAPLLPDGSLTFYLLDDCGMPQVVLP